MYGKLLTVAAILIIIIGLMLLVKIAMPRYIWVDVRVCQTSKITVVLRNDSPFPVKVGSLTVYVYGENGTLLAVEKLELNDTRVPPGLRVERDIVVKEFPIPPHRVSEVEVRVDYTTLLFLKGSVTMVKKPWCLGGG